MQRQKRILTLDGGGVRGLSSLLILRKLLCLINVELTGEDLPVAAKDVFDLIAGTSTGGLIALMLVKLDMTIDECIAEYQILARHIFEHQSRFGRWTGGFGKARYSGDNLISKVQALIRSKGLADDLKMTDNIDGNGNQRKLKTICSVICRELGGDWGRTRADDPVFLCSDHCHAKNEYSHLICTVCEAARATSAAPTYFPEFKLVDRVLVDGAYGNTNNPSHAVFGHFSDWMRLMSRHTQPVMMVNIGTGTMAKNESVEPAVQGRPLWTYVLPKLVVDVWRVTRDLTTLATECEGVGNLMHEIASMNPLFQYWRFSEDERLCGVALDDWRAVEDESIIAATKKYLEKPEVVEELSRTARALAMHSRAHRYAQRERKVKVDIPTTSSKSTSQEASEEGSPDKTKMVVNLHADDHAVTDTKLELRFVDGIQLDELKEPIVAKLDINGEAREVEIKAAETQRRRRQSSGPGEIFHSARADLQDALSAGKEQTVGM